MWPANTDSLIAYQQRLATAAPAQFALDLGTARIGGCWVCFPRGLSGPGTDHDSGPPTSVFPSQTLFPASDGGGVPTICPLHSGFEGGLLARF